MTQPSGPSEDELGKALDKFELPPPVDWTLRGAKKLAFSFNTPLHRSFQIACSELERLQAEIHKLRGQLSHYRAVEPWRDI